MTKTLNELLRDPIFQLNAVLWLAQPLPAEGEIVSLLHRQGFTVYAIAPLLGLPLDLRLSAAATKTSLQESVRPDVVLVQEIDRRFSFTECKASSVALNSSLPQARSLLIVAGPRAPEILALAAEQVRGSVLAMVIPETDREQVRQALSGLVKELEENKLPAGKFTMLGLQVTDTDIGIQFDDIGGDFFSLVPGVHPFLKREPDTDPRPLYFIPYDPDVSQSNRERIFCKRVLFERMHGTVVAAVGRAHPPAELTFESQKILNNAMFGMYELWENRESARHMRSLCKQLMRALAELVNTVSKDTMIYQPGEGWKARLQSQEQHESVMDGLTRFSCETLDLQTEPQPGLFDDTEDR